MTTAIVVQARMGATRLPGKVLKPIAGRPMISYQLERLRRAKKAERLVVATTDKPADDAIAAFCVEAGVHCVRGSEADVLARYHDALQRFPADAVVRVTADCPLIDPALVDVAIAAFEPGQYDYVSNMLEHTYPYGMAVEVMSADALREAHREAKRPEEREHVTPFIYRHPERYRLKSLTMTPNLSHHRWTVDTREDLELVSRILQALYPRKPQFTMQDVLALLEEHPDWCRINAHVEQRKV
jgi:spore coat polysaccharide biosynthesis protein SpsF